ncbi:MAG TPA: hypothetical protein VLZ75_04160 [Chitinophagales bacterium]|nr:hypothetical protein [Chitinophagales bacterium]
MRDHLDKKLGIITEIWNEYIMQYRFCNSQIKFTPDVQTNYFGDIIKYFSDTNNIIYNKKNALTIHENIENSISFLQAIYIQQDFVIELLHIFKCNIENNPLKNNINYFLNREIRNELVGHPIRKIDLNGTRQLKSSTIFSNSTNSEQISYLRYHIDNNYSFEEVTYFKKDIIKRHDLFIEFYFDLIINKLKDVISSFKIKILDFEITLQYATFKNIITVVSHSFEYIFTINFIYNPEILLKIYYLKNKNLRYSNAIEMFRRDLKHFIQYRTMKITEFIEGTKNDNSNQIDKKISQVSYHYELGKLIDNTCINDFRFFSSLLRNKCKDNQIILEELDNMEKNFKNELEYYCSYYLICNELN